MTKTYVVYGKYGTVTKHSCIVAKLAYVFFIELGSNQLLNKENVGQFGYNAAVFCDCPIFSIYFLSTQRGWTS